MITLKLPYKSEFNFLELNKEYSKIKRISYNLFRKGTKEKEIRSFIKNNIKLNFCDSWITQCAILEGKESHKRFPDKNIIFGGKYNFKQRCLNKITNEEFKLKRISPLNIQGEILQKGNRKFQLDLSNNQIIFKLKHKQHHKLILPKLKNNYKKYLSKLEELSKSKQITYSVRVDFNNIYISFDLSELSKQEIKNNSDVYCGIDLNPTNIGISIVKDKNIIHTQMYEFKSLTEKSKESSDSKKSKYLHNKLKFETIEICKNIVDVCKHHKVNFIFIEQLKFDKKFSNKNQNRLCGNKWLRTLFNTNLSKRCSLENINLFKVNSCYSSIIGNLQNNFIDSVNASLEIGRRGYECIIRKTKQFYPEFNIKDSILHQWKEMGIEKIKNWKNLFLWLKNNPKLRYRIDFSELSDKVFEERIFKHMNSKTNLYIF
jgi:hypothetical protein